MGENRQKSHTIKSEKVKRHKREEKVETMLSALLDTDDDSDLEDTYPTIEDNSERTICIKQLRYEQITSNSSSSDESEFEYFDFTDHRQAINSLARRTRIDFIKKLSKHKQQDQEDVTFKPLNSYVSISKSWVFNEDDCTDSNAFQSSFQQSVVCDVPKGIPSVSIPLEAKEQLESSKTVVCGSSCNASIRKTQKRNLFSARFQIKQNKNSEPNLTSQKDRLPPMPLTSYDLPKNALVLYWGRINMTTKELKDLNLSRCIKGLLEEDHYEFMLLKVQSTKLVLQYCDTSSSNFTEKNFTKHKRKKSMTERFFSSKKDESQEAKCQQGRQSDKPNKSALLSCIGSSHRSFKYHQLLQHTDSLCLRSYDIMRRKKLLEFDYRRIVYCGAEERNIPNSMLMWIYHTEHGHYNAVECYCVECDDQSHAKKLSRAIVAEVSKREY